MMVGRSRWVGWGGSASGAASFAYDPFNWRGKAFTKRAAGGGPDAGGRGQGTATAKGTPPPNYRKATAATKPKITSLSHRILSAAAAMVTSQWYDSCTSMLAKPTPQYDIPKGAHKRTYRIRPNLQTEKVLHKIVSTTFTSTVF